ncbi:tryptophan synthase subunit alpha [Chlamydia caviae]|uniref:Tryptophan synthase alpha chain n=1 Tax=Chlamydia caviae (strain ATCC VR-813 / DSM 19441 / 03DC25 / GPIC) TaxID=227941 RepID=TRPA_CHLCV|nr:tryptophan synthase subunit alpha [Chlamydia caviae]Q822W2.1 RecName: Full=Tryptophan synthase alpha chain [Chlamydia caviae GPIC]AAP05309.1 tryptophan synthase, alpha subunit [Chlamydia caviae GPIC]
MNRIETAFKNTKPFIGYLTGGDGGFDYSVACAHALIRGGVDILEIGFPFSDPVADGPIIQKAHTRALEEKTDSTTILEIAKALRETSNIPLVLFSYYNPLLQKGPQYLHQLKAAGFDAVLIVDLPIPQHANESEPFFQALIEAKLFPIVLATPSTREERLLQIRKLAKGFLYYVSQKGTTGIRSKLSDDFSTQIARLRCYFQIPIVAGFGIANRASAAAALKHADGIVVGSAFVEKLEKKISPEELTTFAQSIDPRQ